MNPASLTNPAAVEMPIATPKRTFWTQSEEDQLRSEYANETQPNLILLSAKLGRSRFAVAMKASRLGLTNWSKPKKRAEDRSVRIRRFGSADELKAFQKEFQRKRIAEYGHPRGMLGVKHSRDAREKISRSSKARWDDKKSTFHSQSFRKKMSDNMLRMIEAGIMRSGYSRSRGGKRKDLGDVYFRSAWEANYARWLNVLVRNGDISGWEYEPKTFIFDRISRGTRAYTPDFLVKLTDGTHEWHEVKGWMDKKSKTRIDRFGRYFPEEKLVIIDSAWFKAANKTLPKLVAGWETGTVHV